LIYGSPITGHCIKFKVFFLAVQLVSFVMEYVLCETTPILWRGDSPRITLKSYLVRWGNLYIAVTQRSGFRLSMQLSQNDAALWLQQYRWNTHVFRGRIFHSKLPAPTRIKSEMKLSQTHGILTSQNQSYSIKREHPSTILKPQTFVCCSDGRGYSP